MGIQMAPSFMYANLSMEKCKQQFLRTQDKLPLVWWRYIDDVFAIWTDGVPCLNAFLQELNNYHTIIKFTADWSAQEATFLDTRVYTSRMEEWKRTYMSNQLASINIYTQRVAILNTAKLLFHTSP